LPGWMNKSWAQKQGGHRYLKERAGLLDEWHGFIERTDNSSTKAEFLKQAGTLTRLLGDPNRPQMKEAIMDQWLELPWVKDLGITKGDSEYRAELNTLTTQKGREIFSLSFVTSLSATHKRGTGLIVTGPDRFDVDFTEIKSITEQKFKIVRDDSGYTGTVLGKKGPLKFVSTESYEAMAIEDQRLSYNTFLKGILDNQTRSTNNPAQLREVAMKFMKDVPPPDGLLKEDLLQQVLQDPLAELRKRRVMKETWGFPPSSRYYAHNLGVDPKDILANPLIGRRRSEAETTGPEDYTTSGRIPSGRMTETTVPEAETIQLINPSIIKVHPSMKQETKLVPIMDYHLSAVNNDGTLRLRGDKDKNKAIVFNQFLPALFDTESEFDYNVKNTSGSSAYGGGQIVRTSLIPALNRLNKAGVKPQEEQMIRENMSRIDSILEVKRNELVAQGMTDKKAIKAELDKLGKIEYFKFMDKANLSESLQQQLVLADLLEKTMVNEEGVATTGVGDTLWNALFEATTPEAQYRAALEIYYRGHHTKPDEDTIKVAEKRFRKYFFPQ